MNVPILPFRTALYKTLLVLALLQFIVLLLKQLKIAKFQQFMQCFEYNKNLNSLIKQNELQIDELSCIHGLKVLSCVLVSVYHILQYNSISLLVLEKLEIDGKSSIQITALLTSIVEPFFVISAILLTLNMLDGIKR